MDKYFVALLPDINQNLNQYLIERYEANKIVWFTKKAENGRISQNSITNNSKNDDLFN